MNHTPGPWKISCGANGIRIIDGKLTKTEAGMQQLCVARCDSNYMSDQEIGANAALIAAAPELLAVCRSLIANLQDRKGTKSDGMLSLGDVVRIKAAIAAAEGRE